MCTYVECQGIVGVYLATSTAIDRAGMLTFSYAIFVNVHAVRRITYLQRPQMRLRW